jgi:hypothetical protein
VDVHVFELGHGEGLAHGLEVDRLPARHPARSRSRREELHHLKLRLRVVRELILAQQLEREALQRVAHQQRRRFVVFDVAGRLAAPEDIVVHARQIVVRERIGVDKLYRGRGDPDPLRIRAGKLARRKRQQRTHALASAENGIAHRLMQAPRRDLGPRQHALQRRLDALQVGLRPRGEINGRRRCRHS